MTFGSLFAGIGGFDLGFERAGLTCEWQVEIDPYCQRVLAKHWPSVRRWDDVRTFPPAGEWGVDVICGGFPCQDISNVGKRAGICGERSGLWGEYARIIRLVRPRIIVVENVAAILFRGLGRVLGDLAALGFDAEWQIIPAAALGAVHIRERLFLVGVDSNTASNGFSAFGNVRSKRAFQSSAYSRGSNSETWWETEPAVDRVADGIPSRSHRHHALGNAVVPQVAQWIGERIVQSCQPQ